MHQMGGGVIANNVLAAYSINPGGGFVAGGGITLDHCAEMYDQAGNGLFHIFDIDDPVGTDDDTLIADLTTCLDVEGGGCQHNLNFFADDGIGHDFAILDQRDHL